MKRASILFASAAALVVVNHFLGRPTIEDIRNRRPRKEHIGQLLLRQYRRHLGKSVLRLHHGEIKFDDFGTVHISADRMFFEDSCFDFANLPPPQYPRLCLHTNGHTCETSDKPTPRVWVYAPGEESK